jgi:sterol desaturase/sphingolipid hydroxylase (fatty acid hydroxylase superfamily)
MFGIAFFFGLLLCGLAIRANSRFRHADRLPMQWWLTGDVTWSAPRVLALAFVPALAIGVLVINAALAVNLQPRPGQGGMVLPGLIGTGILFTGIQLLHFWLIRKTLCRDDS